MADNIIQRIIKMVLDKESAKKTQDDANQMASKIDDTWKSVAQKIGGYLAAGFLISKVIAFGKAAIAEATSSEKAWKQLKGTIDNTGASYDAMQDKIVAAANAFQDSTIHDDDAFAETMGRMVTLTGDAAASLNNMGLVANVAAQFFNGELEPAANLVAKAMNGNTNALKKMGIQAKDAQDALNILAQRSMGAATREAKTFDGQMHQLSETYKDMLKEVGNAIIMNDGATDGVSVLRAALQALTKWVHENRDAISLWVTKGVMFAIDAADVFIRAIVGMSNVIGGGFMSFLGLASVGLAKLALGLVAVRNGVHAVQDVFGMDNKKQKDETKAIEEQAEALEEWGKQAHNTGVERVKIGVDVLATPMFSSKDFMGKLKIPDLTVNRPMVGKNQSTDATKEVTKALEDFQKEAKAAANMQKVLGDQFDATGAEIDRTTKLLNVLAANGLTPASVGMAGLSEHLQDLVKNMKPVHDALKTFHEEEKVAENSHKILGDRFDATGAEIDRTTKLLNVLAANGIDPTTIGLGDLSGRLTQLVTNIKPVEDATKSLAKSLKSNLATSAIESSAAIRELQRQQDATLESMNTLIAQGVDPQSPRIRALVKEYDSLQKRIGSITAETTVSRLKQQQGDILSTIKSLLDEGLDPTSQAITDLTERYNKLTDSISDTEKIQAVADAYASLGEEIRMAAFTAALEGANGMDALQAEQQALLKSIQDLISKGIKVEDKALQDLIHRYKEVSKAIQMQTAVMELQTAVADVLAEALGAALQGGLHEAAVAKAKQNAIEAAEMIVRAGAFALMGRYDKAGQALALAGEFAAVAAMWGAFAAVTGGGGGGSDTGGAGAGGGGSSSSMGDSRASSNDAANRADQPKTEVTINLVGPGFHALNPAVQEVVWGATQEASERFGPNTRIRISSQQ